MRHPFELDLEIIHHIIYSQAGSVAKALIELIMNSVDAGAGAVILDITPEGFTCCDDGHGFASHDDVKRYFGRFGTPTAKAMPPMVAFVWAVARLWHMPGPSGAHSAGRWRSTRGSWATNMN